MNGLIEGRRESDESTGQGGVQLLFSSFKVAVLKIQNSSDHIILSRKGKLRGNAGSSIDAHAQSLPHQIGSRQGRRLISKRSRVTSLLGEKSGREQGEYLSQELYSILERKKEVKSWRRIPSCAMPVEHRLHLITRPLVTLPKIRHHARHRLEGRNDEAAGEKEGRDWRGTFAFFA